MKSILRTGVKHHGIPLRKNELSLDMRVQETSSCLVWVSGALCLVLTGSLSILALLGAHTDEALWEVQAEPHKDGVLVFLVRRDVQVDPDAGS